MKFKNLKNIIIISLVFTSCSYNPLMHNTNYYNKLRTSFGVADSLYLKKEFSLASKYIYQNLTPYYKYFDKYRKTTFLNYLVSSKEKFYIDKALTHIKNENFYTIDYCSLDSILKFHISKPSNFGKNHELEKKMKTILYKDQIYRIQSSNFKNGSLEMDSIVKNWIRSDKENQKEINDLSNIFSLRKLIDESNGCYAETIFMVAMHSDDLIFQKKILKEFYIQLNSNKINPKYFAYLSDRISVNLNQPQIYGTQMQFDSISKKMIPYKYKTNIDSIRYRMNLPSLKSYLLLFN